MLSAVPPAFFSYCRADAEFALRLAEDLKAAGANVWMDQLDIEPGTPWDGAVEEALKSSPRMLVILSPVSARSDNVRDEVSFALSRQKRIIPILYRDCDVPFRLARLQHIDFRIDYARGLKALIRTLGIEEPAQATTAPAPSTTTPTQVPKVRARTTANTKSAKEERERNAVEAQPIQFGRANQLYCIGDWRFYRKDSYCCFWYKDGELALEVEGHLQSWRLKEGGTEWTIIHGKRNSKGAFQYRFWKTTTGDSAIVVDGRASFAIKGWVSPKTHRLTISALPEEICITDGSGFVSQIVLPRYEARIHHTNYLKEKFDYP